MASDSEEWEDSTTKSRWSLDVKVNSTKVFVWGLNDKDQLGGQKGSKIKLPVFSDTLSNLKPIHIAGGSKSLFIVTQEGKVFACGEGKIFFVKPKLPKLISRNFFIMFQVPMED